MIGLTVFKQDSGMREWIKIERGRSLSHAIEAAVRLVAIFQRLAEILIGVDV